MNLPWLEDFLALSTALNFSNAARMRGLTQSAFSRRIQNLEAWVGTSLVDRSTVPVSLTEDGASFRNAAEEVVQFLNNERESLRDKQRQKMSFITFATLPNIAVSFMPEWMKKFEGGSAPFKTRILVLNQHDCMQHLESGSCDIYLAYHHESALLQLDTEKFDWIRVGEDRLVPVSVPTSEGRPLFELGREDQRPIPYLDHPPQTFAAKLIDHMRMRHCMPPRLDVRHESTMTIALKCFALAGEGLLWVPERLVQSELASGELVIAGDDDWILPIEIRAYRQRGETRRNATSFWSQLCNLTQ
jgi:DNA-binding transcriptional LysR family regulator